MDITLSRRNITLGILALTLLLVGGGGYYARSKGLLDQWLYPTKETVLAADEPALLAVAAIYSPDTNAGQAAWESKVCADMTTDGCQLFKNMYSAPIWNSAKAGTIPKSASFSFIGVAEKLPDGGEVWKLSSSDALVPAIYIMVAQDSATHKWMLVRALFNQEVKARYGG